MNKDELNPTQPDLPDDDAAPDIDSSAQASTEASAQADPEAGIDTLIGRSSARDQGEALILGEAPAVDDPLDTIELTRVPPPDDPAPVVDASPEGESARDDDWFPGDVDEALAAVAALSEIMPDTEADAQARDDAKARARAPKVASALPAPPLFTLRRGSLASLIPALLLIGGGAYLTLTLAAGETVDPLLLLAGTFGGVLIALLSAWIASGRWSRGVLFVALLLVLVGGVVAFALQPSGIDLTRAYPLLLAALGVACILAGALGRPAQARLLIPGAALIAGAVAGMAFTLGLIPGEFLPVITQAAPFVLLAVVVILLLPLVFRRRTQG